jgi:membrane fusion protein, heavy metal efflux system
MSAGRAACAAGSALRPVSLGNSLSCPRDLPCGKTSAPVEERAVLDFDLEHRESHKAEPAKTLPRPLQFGLLVAIAAVMLGLATGGPPLWRIVAQPEAIPHLATLVEPGIFRPTEREWAGLKMAPIQLMTFRDAHETDGSIAIDEDATTPVYTPYSGRVTMLYATTGDDVAQGAPLLAVQATEFVQAQNDLIATGAALRTAQAQLNLAATNEKRQHALYLAQGAALKDWQQSQLDLATAQGGFASARIALGSVRNRLRIFGKTDAEIARLEAASASDTDGSDQLPLDPQAVVRAPIAGTIIGRQVGLGQNIVSVAAGGATPVFQIGDLSKVWLSANARESDAPALHVGDLVEVHVAALPGRTFKAKLSFVAASIDPATHRLPVRAEIDNSDRALKPQMFASFTIISGAASEFPAVPDDAVIFEGDTARVWVAHDNKTLELRAIKPGRESGGMIEARDGLHAGETVVTSGSVFIDRAAKSD